MGEGTAGAARQARVLQQLALQQLRVLRTSRSALPRLQAPFSARTLLHVHTSGATPLFYCINDPFQPSQQQHRAAHIQPGLESLAAAASPALSVSQNSC